MAWRYSGSYTGPVYTPRREREESPVHSYSRRNDANLLFYQGKIPAQPDNVYIDDIHRNWSHDMQRLERGHNYIQWLFPIREKGLNPHAQELQPHEARAIQDDPQAMARFVRSYEMMLHFYGMRLISRNTGAVTRDTNWEEQFRNLNFSEHNFLRITRILKSLGEMGLERFKAHFIKFILTEAIENRKLSNVLNSCQSHWIPTVKDSREREKLQEHIRQSVEARQRAERASLYQSMPSSISTNASSPFERSAAVGIPNRYTESDQRSYNTTAGTQFQRRHEPSLFANSPIERWLAQDRHRHPQSYTARPYVFARPFF